MGGFEVELPGMGGWVYKFQGSSCVSTQIASTPLPGKILLIDLKIICMQDVANKSISINDGTKIKLTTEYPNSNREQLQKYKINAYIQANLKSPS